MTAGFPGITEKPAVIDRRYSCPILIDGRPFQRVSFPQNKTTEKPGNHLTQRGRELG